MDAVLQKEHLDMGVNAAYLLLNQCLRSHAPTSRVTEDEDRDYDGDVRTATSGQGGATRLVGRVSCHAHTSRENLICGAPI
jgi:hypothetical protein